MIPKGKNHLLKVVLHAEGEIQLRLSDLRVRRGRFSEEFRHAFREVTGEDHCPVRLNLHSLVAAKRLEIIKIELEAAVFEPNNFANLAAIRVLAIRREAHDLALIAVFLIADEFADNSVE